MVKPVGGFGRRAPYTTKLIRVPEPLEHQVAELKARYYGFIDGGGEPSKPINWIKDEEISPPGGEERNTLAEISELVRRWENDLIGVNQKTNVRWSRAAKLLTELREIIGED